MFKKPTTPTQELEKIAKTQHRYLDELPQVVIKKHDKALPAVALRINKHLKPHQVEVFYPYYLGEQPEELGLVNMGKFGIYSLGGAKEATFVFKREWHPLDEVFLLEQEKGEIKQAITAVLYFDNVGLFSKNVSLRKEARRKAFEAVARWEHLLEEGLNSQDKFYKTAHDLIF